MVKQAVLAAMCTAAVALGVSGCRERIEVTREREVYVPPPPAVEPGEVNVGFFYERLAPYGTWYRQPAYGWVWSPANVPLGWRPYTEGHWVYTDDCGWTWVSNWPWGWAPFHYGRWAYDEGYGWVWVPGREWGPAWVAWRHGGGYVGWAPLPPNVRWRGREGLELRGVDLDDLPRRDWVFVPERHFLSPVQEHVILPQRNVTIHSATRNVTRFADENGRVAIRSIPPEAIEKTIGRRVEREKVLTAPSPEAMRLPREQEGGIRVYRPKVAEAPPSVTPPGREEVDRRRAVEMQQLRERADAERQQLDRRHEAERRQEAQQRVDRGRLEDTQKRHQAETSAMQAEHERQQRTLEQRQARERGPYPPQPAKPAPRDRGDRD